MMRTKIFYSALALMSLVPTAWGNGSAVPEELRGAWLNPPAFATPEAREETLKKILKANLNTLLVRAPQLGDNHGAGDPEAFASFLREARRHGLAVHGWICNHWRNGREGKVYFRDPDERKQQVAWVLALLNTFPDLDGVHFDYIRYREWEAVDADKMNGITTTIEQARKAIQEKYPGKFLTATSFVAGSANYHGAWRGD